ncbi:MAG: radical SAM protein, partial [Hyphomicrobiaceae bacterium]|nr:radical SAM protein [Hyphomicrobiaceae bacterium]
PALNDMEIEQIVAAGAEAGAVSAGYILLRLPLEVRDVFRDWLAKAYPERYRHVMSLIRQMRGGKDYDAEWMKRMRGEGPYADLIARRFEAAIKRHGLTRRSLDLDCTRFRPPRPDSEQMCFPF